MPTLHRVLLQSLIFQVGQKWEGKNDDSPAIFVAVDNYDNSGLNKHN